ncbi:hypothetical protein [Streptomyces atratus]|uniref:hypothetical protein n=1 Tax=Streptomyces atratus TaxID=1893 RepID=UPI00366653A4
MSSTGSVDFTNKGFVQQYAIVFAASAFLVILMWLTRAMGEAIGLLWLVVIASAFTPLILHVVVGAVDSITDSLAGEKDGGFFQAYSKALSGSNSGGPIRQIILSLVAILSAGVVWFELVIRAALLYVGAALGTVVYAGHPERTPGQEAVTTASPTAAG